MPRFTVSLFCIAILFASNSAFAEQPQAVWALQSDGVLKVSPIDAAVTVDIVGNGENGAIAVDGATGNAWVYTTGRLRALDANGSVVVDVVDPALPASSAAILAIDAARNRIFLGAANTLHIFDANGALTSTYALPRAITSLAVDGNRGLLWITSGQRELYRYDGTSAPSKVQLGPSWEDARTVVVDAQADMLWVLRYSVLERYSAVGENRVSLSFPPEEYIRYVAADGQGGAWVADHDDLYHLDATLQWSDEINVFSGPQWYWWWGEMNVIGVVSDASDGSVWVTVDRMLQHYSMDGTKLHEFHAELADGRRPRLWEIATGPDNARPSIRIASPASGAYTNDNEPDVEIVYTETGGTVDRDSLELKLNDQAVAANCTDNANSAICQFTEALPDGTHVVQAFALDEQGAQLSTAPVQFHVDTIAPAITFSTPGDGDYTNQTTIAVTGSLSEMSALRINGAAVPVDARNQFTTSVTLVEGHNTIQASAADAAGNAATQVVTVIRDTVVPFPADIGLIGFTTSPDGEVVVSAPPETVEPGAAVTVRNTRTGVTVTVVADASGGFSVSVAAVEGDQLAITVSDAAGNASASTNVAVPDLSTRVEIEIQEPIDGVALNTSEPAVSVRYIRSGAGIDHATLEFTVNGTPTDLQCEHTVTHSQCDPLVGLADGGYLLSATVNDVSGVSSNIASTQFAIDTVVPVAPDADKIAQSGPDDEGLITLVGSPSAVEVNAMLTVQAAEQHQVQADSEGGFLITFAADIGDVVELTVRDSAGNISQPLSVTIHEPPLTISFLSPIASATVSGPVVDVTGTHNGGLGTGVTVNGVPAAVAAGSFYALSVPIDQGQNTLIARAVSSNGDTTEAQITVTGVQSDSPLQISPRSPQGPAPHPTRFEVAYLGDPLTISAITIDYDGDGTVDQAALNPSENFEYTFSAPGIYHPTLTLATGSETYTAQTTVVVQSVAELDAFLKESWNSFNQSLLEGNIEAALQKMSHSARKKYGPAYETILPYIQQGIASYSEAEAIEIHANWAEYLVTREKDGEIYGFKVRMVRGIDGIWRINEL